MAVKCSARVYDCARKASRLPDGIFSQNLSSPTAPREASKFWPHPLRDRAK